MKIANNRVSQNLAKLLGYTYHYARNAEFENNLELIYKKTGINKFTIRNWIAGKNGHPQFANLKKVAELFNVDIYMFFEDPRLLSKHKKIIEILIKIKNDKFISRIEDYIDDQYELYKIDQVQEKTPEMEDPIKEENKTEGT